jgi:hypothetical protein
MQYDEDIVMRVPKHENKTVKAVPQLRPPRESFGPVLWTSTEDIIESLPPIPSEVQQKALLAYLESLCHLIPCAECQWHFERQVQTKPLKIPFTSEMASIWLWEVHNAVNVRTGKPEILHQEQQVLWKRRAKMKRSKVVSYDPPQKEETYKLASDIWRIATAILIVTLVLVSLKPVQSKKSKKSRSGNLSKSQI